MRAAGGRAREKERPAHAAMAGPRGPAPASLARARCAILYFYKRSRDLGEVRRGDAETLHQVILGPHLAEFVADADAPSGSTKQEFLDRALLGDPRERDFFDLEFEDVRSTFDLNFLGTLLPTKVVARGMVERGSDAILNIASMGAFTPLTQVGAYSAAKAAVANFTAWLAVHFARTGVRVNAIAPGFFMTEQLKFLHID